MLFFATDHSFRSSFIHVKILIPVLGSYDTRIILIHPFNKSRRHFEFLINDVIRG